MNKRLIGDQYLKLRIALTDHEFLILNQGLTAMFFSSIDLSAVSTLHIFLPIIAKKEPNTWLMINRLKKEHPHIRISLPKMRGENDLVNFYFEGENQLEPNPWGVPEPQFGVVTDVSKIDLVVVPLLSFDQQGHRVGYGKGYYDHFLQKCRPGCNKVGLSLFEPVGEIEDINDHDVKLTYCVTPTKCYSF